MGVECQYLCGSEVTWKITQLEAKGGHVSDVSLNKTFFKTKAKTFIFFQDEDFLLKTKTIFYPRGAWRPQHLGLEDYTGTS